MFEWQALWQDFHFLRPWGLLCLLPALGLYVLAFWRRRLNNIWGDLVKPEYLELLTVEAQGQAWLNPMRLMLLSCIVASLALAGPSWKLVSTPLQQSQQAVFVVLQLNESMQADEQKLLKAKLKIKNLLNAHKTTAISLLVFSGSAHTVLPLSKDQQALHLYLGDLHSGLMPQEGFRPDLAMLRVNEQLAASRYAQHALLFVGNNERLEFAASQLEKKDNMLLLHWSTHAHDLDDYYRRQGFEQLLMSDDNSDVEALSALLRRQAASNAQGQDENWQDSGYLFSCLLLLLVLLWFRRGMVLNWL